MAPRKRPAEKLRRRPHGSGGTYEKTRYRIDPITKKRIPVKYWEASREVPEHLRREGGRPRVTGSGATPKEAQEHLESNWAKMLTGDRTRRSNKSGPSMTLGDLFILWDEDNRLRPNFETIAAIYAGNFRHHILPHLRNRPLAKLSSRDLDHLFHDILPAKTKGPNDPRPLLGGSARRNIYIALSGCLNFGVRRNHLPYSPLSAVTPPRRTKVQEPVADYAEMAYDLLAALAKKDDPNYCRWLFQFLGLRRAERLGLTWSQVKNLDGKEPRLVISKQLARHQDGSGWYLKNKTKNHLERTIVLPELFAAALREHRTRQDAWKKSATWKPHPEFADLVFLKSNGALITPNRDNYEWHELLNEYGLPHWRGHINRHITAVWLAEERIQDIRLVQSILGHESEAMSYYYAQDNSRIQAEGMRRYGDSLAKRIGRPK